MPLTWSSRQQNNNALLCLESSLQQTLTERSFVLLDSGLVVILTQNAAEELDGVET